MSLSVRIRCAAAVLLLLVSAAQADAQKQGKILMLGDSVTRGGMPEAVEGPLNELTEGKVAWTLVNAGVGGETAEGGAARIDKLLESEKPHVVTVSYGLNDLARNHDAERFRSNMLKIIEAVQKRSPAPKVVLLTCTPFDATRHSLGKIKRLNDRGGADRVLELEHNAVTRRLAAENRLPLVDLHRYFMTDPKWATYLRDDGVHLTKEGYDFSGKYVATVLATWYEAEVAKEKKAVKVRNVMLGRLKTVAQKSARGENRAAALVALDAIWRACPYLSAQGLLWHSVQYADVAARPAPDKVRPKPTESPKTHPPTKQPKSP